MSPDESGARRSDADAEGHSGCTSLGLGGRRAHIALVGHEPCLCSAARSCILGMRAPRSPIIRAGYRTVGVVTGGLRHSGSIVTLLASAFPVRMPRGTLVSVSSGPDHRWRRVLGGPCRVPVGSPLIGSHRAAGAASGRVPWDGTLVNHAGIVLPSIAGPRLPGALTLTRTRAHLSPQ